MGSNDELAEKVKSILQAAFEPAEVECTTRHGVVVFVTSDRFSGRDDMDRQDIVWDVLEKNLDRDEQRAVAIVVALTYKERQFHDAASIE
jgi:acid stress-induced BolA-like protein IbaG/YrbA